MYKKLKSLLIIMMLIVVSAAFTACGNGGASSKEKAVEAFYQAACNDDIEQYMACMFPKSIVDQWIENASMTEEEFYELQSEFMRYSADAGLHENVEIVEEEALDDSEIDTLESDIYSITSGRVDISEAYDSIRIEYTDENGNPDTEYIGYFYKIGGTWYVLPKLI